MFLKLQPSLLTNLGAFSFCRDAALIMTFKDIFTAGKMALCCPFQDYALSPQEKFGRNPI